MITIREKFGMANIRLDKKSGMILAGVLAVTAVFILVTASLVTKVRDAGNEVKALEEEMTSARQVIQSQKVFRPTGDLLTRSEISLAIDEITRMGATRKISFVSISPEKITRLKDSKYPVLPIRMNLQAQYKDLGRFLGSLEELKKSVVTVKSFRVESERPILPQVRMDLVIEVYLREGEDG